MSYSFVTMESPVGRLTLVANETSLVSLSWANEKPKENPFSQMQNNPKHPILREAQKQLNEYFCGKRTQFDLPLAPVGTTFQKGVWRALQKIPYGKTWSYGELAKKIHSPKASRAVGGANGRNPISIIIPCHRVIGADGSLTGFGGGLRRKEILLKIEDAQASFARG